MVEITDYKVISEDHKDFLEVNVRTDRENVLVEDVTITIPIHHKVREDDVTLTKRVLDNVIEAVNRLENQK